MKPVFKILLFSAALQWSVASSAQVLPLDSVLLKIEKNNLSLKSFSSKINSLNEYSYRVDRSHNVMFQLQRLQSAMKDTETSQKGFLLTKDSTFLR